MRVAVAVPIPLLDELTPREIVRELDKYVIGQADAKKAVAVALRNPRVLAFVGVWFGLNLLFGIGSFAIVGVDQSIAWEAHFGGFFAGLLLFSLFDPVAPQTLQREEQPTLH